MFKIYDGREKFYQWDLDRQLIIEDPSVTEVHFTNRATNDAYVCETYVEDGKTLVNVPNILLQTNWRIQAYAYDGKHTKHDICYEVVSRSKPVDYVYTETEVLSYENLANEIEQLREEMQQQEVLTEEQIANINMIPIISDTASDANIMAIDNQQAINEMDMELYTIANDVNVLFNDMYLKQDVTNVIHMYDRTDYVFNFAYTNNYDERLMDDNTSSISFVFGNGVYNDGYVSGISFVSGATPTRIDYTDSGILNWVGTDCSNVDGYSIFKPEPNKHYDIVFYFNSRQFVGLVNGYVPSLGNVVA